MLCQSNRDKIQVYLANWSLLSPRFLCHSWSVCISNPRRMDSERKGTYHSSLMIRISSLFLLVACSLWLEHWDSFCKVFHMLRIRSERSDLVFLQWIFLECIQPCRPWAFHFTFSRCKIWPAFLWAKFCWPYTNLSGRWLWWDYLRLISSLPEICAHLIGSTSTCCLPIVSRLSEGATETTIIRSQSLKGIVLTSRTWGRIHVRHDLWFTTYCSSVISMAMA